MGGYGALKLGLAKPESFARRFLCLGQLVYHPLVLGNY